MAENATVRPATPVADWNRLIEQQLPGLDSEYPLTGEQIDQFWEQGFIVLRDVLSPDEINAYGEAIREVAMAHFRARGLKTYLRYRVSTAAQLTLLLGCGHEICQ